MPRTEGFQDRLLSLMPHLNERQLRLAAALEARSLGYGSVSAVAQATGMARGTIHRALEELSLNIEPHKFHGEWNYTIRPRKQRIGQ